MSLCASKILFNSIQVYGSYCKLLKGSFFSRQKCNLWQNKIRKWRVHTNATKWLQNKAKINYHKYLEVKQKHT